MVMSIVLTVVASVGSERNVLESLPSINSEVSVLEAIISRTNSLVKMIDFKSKDFQENINQVNNQYHEELLKTQEAENIIENSSNEDEVSFAHEAIHNEEHSLNEQEGKNDLSEFGVESNAPDLFNNEIESSNSNELLSSESDDDQEDDLEIPAFLRRQKN